MNKLLKFSAALVALMGVGKAMTEEEARIEERRK